MLSLSHENHETFNSTSLYLDDANEYFEQTIDTIYPKEALLPKIRF